VIAANMAKKQRAKRPNRAKTKTSPVTGRVQRRERPATRDPLGLADCERFLVQEARLLDEARFDDWLALFTSDAWYWVPSQPDQPDPHETVSLIYDDRRLLETRVRRLASPRMYSQEPRSRTSRTIANVTIEAAEPAACTVRSKFVMIEFRRDSQRIFGGTAFHRLVRTDNGLRIAWKRVDLVNCDATMDGITIPF
jgi:3-phenylpropionate/cinnamic acid dioxygenase small subunit